MKHQLQLFARASAPRIEHEDLVVDCFAGGGGASLGVSQALGRPVDIAINHSREAIALHARNHRDTDHFCEDIWTVDPRTATGGKPVSLLWASPDCRHFSRAKGGKPPASPRVRSLAWVVVTWARRVRPAVICLENVEEFQTWGPLHDDGTPDEARRGQTFKRWVSHLRNLGYTVEYRALRACDYGAPTTRRRLFIVARCDGQPIVWPTPTHGPGRSAPHRTAAECIDWSLPVPSIFNRKKRLAHNTEARIALGIKRFVIDAEARFIPPVTAPPVNHEGHVIIAPTMIQTGYGERRGQAPRALDLHKPLGTAVAGGAKHALVYAFLARHFGGVVGRALSEPLPTVTTKDHHSLVTALLARHAGGPQDGLVNVRGMPHRIVDIGMRMLSPRELARAQGFPDAYHLDTTVDGAPITQSAQIRMIGNSVCPPIAGAIIRANAGSKHLACA